MYNNYAFYKRVNGIYKVVRVIENGLSYVDGYNWVADVFEDRDEMEEEYAGFELVRVKRNTIEEILGMGYPA
jgi:hypothetical protein